jgi:hypothetical protein
MREQGLAARRKNKRTATTRPGKELVAAIGPDRAASSPPGPDAPMAPTRVSPRLQYYQIAELSEDPRTPAVFGQVVLARHGTARAAARPPHFALTVILGRVVV